MVHKFWYFVKMHLVLKLYYGNISRCYHNYVLWFIMEYKENTSSIVMFSSVIVQNLHCSFLFSFYFVFGLEKKRRSTWIYEHCLFVRIMYIRLTNLIRSRLWFVYWKVRISKPNFPLHPTGNHLMRSPIKIFKKIK